jgi:hypothetical protein
MKTRRSEIEINSKPICIEWDSPKQKQVKKNIVKQQIKKGWKR